ncbi:MAG: TetR/AcrR family transcriptional regulator [Pseudomonadales bacterium]|nr:TetR/AcrR family transcriptional regulator [Pseudomonadales bacterium]
MKFELPPQNFSDTEDKSRQKILDCARELYLEFGLRRTTMDDVAKRAGMGRATLYRRFSDKDQLFQAVIFRDVQHDIVEIDNAVRESVTYLDGLIEAFVIAVSLIHKNPMLSRLLQTEPDHVLPFLTTQFDGILGFSRIYIAKRIEAGQAAGDIKQMSAELIAETVLRLTHSLMLTPNGVIHPGNEDSIRDFANLFIRPLLTP